MGDSTNKGEEMTDGYGLPFPPEAQQRHAENVIRANREYQEWLASQKIEHVEPEWKDKPAGYKYQGSGV